MVAELAPGRARPRRRRVRGALAVLGALMALLLVAAVFIAYVWQPSAAAYASPYLARVESRYAETPGVRFHYTRTGHGSPVVLVAGGGQWLYSYRDTIPALAHHHTVYAVDLPGQGYTTVKQPGFGYDLDAMSAALGSFMDAVRLPRAALVGHSWGGSWSLYFAERHPERVTRLVLIDATGLDVPASWDWRPWSSPSSASWSASSWPGTRPPPPSARPSPTPTASPPGSSTRTGPR